MPMKRLEIIDDSGWTHITKGTHKQKLQRKYAIVSSSEEKLLPAEIPKGLTLRDVTNSFGRYTKTWQDSSCLIQLQTLRQDFVLASNIEFNKCVCLGLGSLTGGDRTETSFFELAALVSILEILGQYSTLSRRRIQDAHR